MSIQETLKGADSLDIVRFSHRRCPAESCFVLLIDAQARLVPAISQGEAVVSAMDRLVRAAGILGVPAYATEHCADAIGPTVPLLADRIGRERMLAKRHFDATRAPGLTDRLAELERPVAVVAGVEAHVCVAQTALGLGSLGWRVAVVEDACGSRRQDDREVGLARLRAAGAVPVTVEALIFEWLGSADHPAFREALGIVKEG
ncbi:isochorismatase family protein [Thalassobaculum sp. OXR-137]|uniref:isochorismatase family protein n=1 Tax=Thalassobaculum sp. OXR-137 TaxID=3100173 RepID=UPI002AC998AE|nr:isochorismatase family protein [Thalassobaculum sp. OXR-137]WPZ33376.1 isochorismatase family protein [Thalassobaculum sp. OXR-137]